MEAAEFAAATGGAEQFLLQNQYGPVCSGGAAPTGREGIGLLRHGKAAEKAHESAISIGTKKSTIFIEKA